MNTWRYPLLGLLVMAFEMLRSQEKSQSLHPMFMVLFAFVIMGWLALCPILLGFIDRRNHSKKLQGLAGFVTLFLAILAIGWLVFRLKLEFGVASDASVSFRDDSFWLVLFPVLAYHSSRKNRRTLI